MDISGKYGIYQASSYLIYVYGLDDKYVSIKEVMRILLQYQKFHLKSYGIYRVEIIVV